MRIKIQLAGHIIEYQFYEAGTEHYFQEFLTENKKAEFKIDVLPSELTAQSYRFEHNASRRYMEFLILAEKTSDALLVRDGCIFHCAVMVHKGKAYAFTGPSGTGKTTHYVMWKLLYGEDIQILNGDKPILKCREDSAIWMYPSPWKGKEGMGNMLSAPLAGIVVLSQSNHNAMRRMSLKESIVPLYEQFLFSRGSIEQVRRALSLEEKVLRTVPVWHLENRGDEEAIRLCRNTILEEVSE